MRLYSCRIAVGHPLLHCIQIPTFAYLQVWGSPHSSIEQLGIRIQFNCNIFKWQPILKHPKCLDILRLWFKSLFFLIFSIITSNLVQNLSMVLRDTCASLAISWVVFPSLASLITNFSFSFLLLIKTFYKYSNSFKTKTDFYDSLIFLCCFWDVAEGAL